MVLLIMDSGHKINGYRPPQADTRLKRSGISSLLFHNDPAYFTIIFAVATPPLPSDALTI